MKKILGVSAVLFMSGMMMAQEDEQWKEHVNVLKEKSDKFNVYLNTQTAFEMSDENKNREMVSSFKVNQLRLEFRGDLTEKIFYRLRHRLNRNTGPSSQDNLSTATDMMYVGFKINKKVAITGGKISQSWGGFEFDDNPIYVYEYSDFINHMTPFLIGGLLTYMPNKNHEFNINVTNSGNKKFRENYSKEDGTPLVGTEDIVESKSPLAYIFNWNGNLFDGILQTRWAIGYEQETKHYGNTMITFGTKLHLPKFYMFFDYMRAHEDLDKKRYAQVVGSNEILKNVIYNSFIYQAVYQPNEQWNFILKGTYDYARVGDVPAGVLDTHRKSFGYSISVEHMPFKGQDLRFFFTYVGRKYNYKYLDNLDNSTNRFMLGMTYRIKAF